MKPMKIIKLFTIIGSIFLGACSSDDDLDTTEDPSPVEEVDVWTVNKENQHALDVVFFKPSDFQVDETLINEVSEMMLYIQGWYEKQMELQGFGKKTFGLMTNQKGKVRVYLVEGQQPSSSYDGYKAIVSEINEYFASNSGFREGSHLFVLGSSGSGVPFYGLGKTAFVTSENFKLESTGQTIDGFGLKKCDKLGGIMHELGHGLNLPHNAHKASNLTNIALMSFGNHTYQKDGQSDLVYLTKASCAILDVNQVFNSKDKQYYDVSPSIEMKSYTVAKDNTKRATIVQGTFTSEVKATHFYAGHNGYPLAGGYDNITFTTEVVPTANANEYPFYVEMPYQDIFNGYQAKDILELSMVVITENGNKKVPVKYDYTISDLSPEPNDDILKEYIPFEFTNRSSWIITANSTAPNAERVASKMIDGNLESYWHSSYPYAIETKGSHEITIDMSEISSMSGVYLVSSRNGGQFRPKHIIVQSSSDGAVWEMVKEVTLGSIGNAAEVKISFDNSISTRHFKIIVDQVYMSTGVEENLIFNEVDTF